MEVRQNLIVDAFMFYNELDLLEIRLNILGDVVDKFVIVESPVTFTGREKHLYYNENKERFAKWADKIVHYIIDDAPGTMLDEEVLAFTRSSPNIGEGEHWWVREFYQKEMMLKALSFCQDEDIVFISDVDEIWNPELVTLGLWNKDRVYKPIMTEYNYYLNNRCSRMFGVGTRFGEFSLVKKFGINHFRTDRETAGITQIMADGGWHFSFMGRKEDIIKKLEAYSHQEYNVNYIKDALQSKIESNVDFLNRGANYTKTSEGLPQWLLDNKDKYPHLWL